MRFGISWSAHCIRLLVLAAVVLTMNSASEAKADDPPTILSFSWINPLDNYFFFYGYVEDEYPEACIVEFYGVLRGYYATADGSGYFCTVAELPYGTIGDVEAIAFDVYDQFSDPAGTFVYF
jgi:hypothetical protein